MFIKKTIRDVDVQNKKILLRADYNVPIKAGQITDDYRITQSLPTLNYLLEHHASIVICSHLGRPNGHKDQNYSLLPVIKRLAQLLNRPVEFAVDCLGESTIKAVSKMKPGSILLLENLRFYPEEEDNNSEFASKLAEYADLFVQDGFGVVHRAHASTDAITRFLPSVAGLLLEKEVDTLTKVMKHPKRPLTAVIGGAKIADKIDILHRFIEIADFVALGGAMANTFIAAEGIAIEDSMYDKEELMIAKDIIVKAAQESSTRDFTFTIPFDAIVTSKIDKTMPTRIIDWKAHELAEIESYPKKPLRSFYTIEPHEHIVDIGPFSGSFIAGAVQLSQTVVWNGTMGVTEIQGLQGPVGPYSHGTELVIEACIGEFGHRPFSVVGGGDTVGYLANRKLIGNFDHVSTGGGASLELMGGRRLPGLEALENKD